MLLSTVTKCAIDCLEWKRWGQQIPPFKSTRNRTAFTLVEFCLELRWTSQVELRRIHAQGLCFLLEDLQLQLDGGAHLNNDLKEQVAVAEQQNTILQSEGKELRFLQEYTEYGHSLSEWKRALRSHRRNDILHIQVASISSFHYLGHSVESSSRFEICPRSYKMAITSLGFSMRNVRRAMHQGLCSQVW